LPAIGESFDHQGWRFEVVISMAGALTEFWSAALPLGGATQRFRQIRSGAEP
jgi:hypothetical protein